LASLTTHEPLCKECYGKLQPVVTTYIHAYGYTVPVYALAAYNGPIKKLILSKMHGNRTPWYALSQLLATHPIIETLHASCFVPIPLSTKRYAQRGFNQSYELARFVTQKTNTPIVNLLQRNRATQYQALLNAPERAANVHDAFSITTKHRINYDHIVLIDDLMTTGSTLKEAVITIQSLHPKKISALVLARAL
jgi:ComF family protein